MKKPGLLRFASKCSSRTVPALSSLSAALKISDGKNQGSCSTLITFPSSYFLAESLDFAHEYLFKHLKKIQKEAFLNLSKYYPSQVQ